MRFWVSTAAVVLVACVPASSLAGSLRILFEDVPCRGRDRIEAEILRSSSGAMEFQPDLVLLLEGRPPSQLLLRLQSPFHSTERVIDLPTSACPSLARSVVLLIRGWLDRRWIERAPVPPGLQDGAAPQSVAANPAPSTPPVPANLQLAVPASQDAAPWNARLRTTAAAGAFVEQPSASEPQLGLRLRVGADWELAESWGLALTAARDAALVERIGTAGGAQVSVTVWQLELLGRASLSPAESMHLDFLAGPALFVLQERSEGLATNQSTAFVDAGVVGAVRWRQNLTKRLEVFAGLEAGVRGTRETLQVAGYGPALTLSRVRGSLMCGALWTVL